MFSNSRHNFFATNSTFLNTRRQSNSNTNTNTNNNFISSFKQTLTAFFNKDNENTKNTNNNNNNITFKPIIINQQLCLNHNQQATCYFEDKYLCYTCLNETLPIIDCKKNKDKVKILPQALKELNNKIENSVNQIHLLSSEITTIREFLYSYETQFNIKNKNKINEIYEYLKFTLESNYNNSLTILSQCMKEHHEQNSTKLKELSIMESELNDMLVDINKVKEYGEDEIVYYEDIINEVFDRSFNYFNYDMEFDLLKLVVKDIKSELKDDVSKYFKDIFKIEIDFNYGKEKSRSINKEEYEIPDNSNTQEIRNLSSSLNSLNIIDVNYNSKNSKNSNNNLLEYDKEEFIKPKLSEVLLKNNYWICICGYNLNNIESCLKCNRCDLLRKIESIGNLVYEPLSVS